MALRIEVAGEWGGALLSDVEAVARSVTEAFQVIGEGESLAIALEPTRGADDPPLAVSTLSPSGEFVVLLNIRGNLWARLAYQFAHEFSHVLADPRTTTRDRFHWVEEVICETASLFALRSMARTWAAAPPYPQWRDYSTHLESYASERMAEPAHCLPPGTTFPNWLADRLPLLETAWDRREDNTIIAKELLPIFEADRGRWRALRHLHDWRRDASATLGDFMEGWFRACPVEDRGAVESLAGVIGAD